MKKQFLLLSLSVFVSTITIKAQNWVEIDPGLTETYRYYSVHFPTAQTGYISGTNGLILKSSDGGETWTEQNSNTTEGLHRIHFVDEQTGFAAGNKTLVKTSDGGITWIKDSIPTNEYVYDFEMIDESNVFFVATGGDVIKYTTDSAYVLDDGINSNLEGVYFLDADTGYVVGGWVTSKSIIVKTTDGGNTWNFKPTPNDSVLLDICFPSAKTGYGVGWAGNLVKTEDFGETWFYMGTTGTSKLLLGVHFLNENLGYICGNNGTLLKSDDGGLNWIDMSIHTKDLESIFMVNENLGFAVGYQTILKYTSGNETLVEDSKNKPFDIQLFPNPVVSNLTVKPINALESVIQITVIDISGKQLLNNQNKNSINVGSLNAGVYFLDIITDHNSYRKQFIKQ